MNPLASISSAQTMQVNAVNDLIASLQYLEIVIKTRLALHFGHPTPFSSIYDVPVPALNGAQHAFAQFIRQHELNQDEFLLLLITLVPHLRPHFFDQVIAQNLPEAGDFPQLGGVRGKQFRGFMPTGETAIFILGGEDLAKRFTVQELLSQEHFFAKHQVLWLATTEDEEPLMSGKLVLHSEYLELFTLGQISPPKFSIRFPADRISTDMEWEDLILHQHTLNQVRELETWVKHGDTLYKDWGMGKRIKPGFRALFYGPPGTGKTLTASLLGKYTGRNVFRIDLSMLVSKFIGETEKNLASLFDKAENKDWILFFDEADALFGKRTQVRDAHDKYANQEVSYLLQRVETYNGLVILASNFKSNIDTAFVRRFQAMIHFPMPRPEERERIWRTALPAQAQLAPDVDLRLISQRHELSGASILNVIQYCCLKVLGDKPGAHVTAKLLKEGISREMRKEEKGG